MPQLHNLPNKKKSGNTFRKWMGKIHLWLGLASGIIVCFLGLTGCLLAFEKEIENLTQPYRFVAARNEQLLAPSALQQIAVGHLPGKKLHSISYQPGKASVAAFYNGKPAYYYLVFMDPYSGKILKTKDMSRDFFRIMISGHYSLFLPVKIGQPIVASATLVFVLMMVSGIILWWPKNKAARKQRFSVKWNAQWRRTNYDLHNVLGFYMTFIAVFVALTGLVMGFQWFSKSVYWLGSGGKARIDYAVPLSDTLQPTLARHVPATDVLWQQMRQKNPAYQGVMDVHFPESKAASIEIAMNPDDGTYWRADYYFFDQNTLKELSVKHAFGKKKDTNGGDMLLRMNYDIHVGAIAGLPGKILVFGGSLICTSLPITGFLIWRGRKKKKKKSHNLSLV
ncbi:MAG: PepSY-associated TM helix domain-containing protein [Edaphocola sp.]